MKINYISQFNISTMNSKNLNYRKNNPNSIQQLNSSRFLDSSYNSNVLLSSHKQDVFLPFFTGKKTVTSKFEVKNIEHLECPVCSKIMISKEEELKFAVDISSKKGEKLVHALEFYEDERNLTQDWSQQSNNSLFRGNRQEIVQKIKKLALEHPNYCLKQLCATIGQPLTEELINSQLDTINELKLFAYYNLKSEEELLKFDKLLDEQIYSIKGENDLGFSRTNFLHELTKISSNTKLQEQFLEIAQRIPVVRNSVDLFFIRQYLNNHNSKKIAQSLFSQSVISVEHLQPKSKKGRDSSSNYICDCSHCNVNRGSTNFHAWQKSIPDFQSKLQRYIANIQRAINNKEIDLDENYLINIAKTIENLSNGEIQLNIPQ